MKDLEYYALRQTNAPDAFWRGTWAYGTWVTNIDHRLPHLFDDVSVARSAATRISKKQKLGVDVVLVKVSFTTVAEV